MGLLGQIQVQTSFYKGNRALLAAASKISTAIPHTLTKSALIPEKVDMDFFTTNLAQCNSNTQWRGGKPYHLSLTILTLFSSVSPVIYVTFLDDWGECWVISVVGHFQYYMYQDQFPLNCRLLFVFVLYFSLLNKLCLQSEKPQTLCNVDIHVTMPSATKF